MVWHGTSRDVLGGVSYGHSRIYLENTVSRWGQVDDISEGIDKENVTTTSSGEERQRQQGQMDKSGGKGKADSDNTKTMCSDAIERLY